MKGLGLIVVALAGLTVTAFAQTPQEGEFRVNTYTAYAQRSSRSAMEADGDFVVVWSNRNVYGHFWGIFGQRYDSTAAPRAGEFRIDQALETQALPAVTVSGGGEFVVVWQHARNASSENIYGRRFDAAGSAVGPEFRINSYTPGFQSLPDVGATPDGRFVVTWTSESGDGSGAAIFARRFDSSGNPVGGEFGVNTQTIGSQYWSRVAVDPTGGFVIAWEDSLPGRDGSGSAIFGQRYDASGNRAGGEFRVNSHTTGIQRLPSISFSPTGGFVVVWGGPGDGSDVGVFARVFDASGTPVANDFVVNTYTTGYQFGFGQQVAHDADGKFVIVWASRNEDSVDVFAQRFDASGARRGGEFRINSFTTGSQAQPAIASNPAGKFVVTWDSYDQDGSGLGVFGQLFGGLQPTGLAVDANAGPTSNGNGVFDPGEEVTVSPSWRNLTGVTQAVTGVASSFNGPAGPVYTIADATAAYGTLGDDATESCTSTGNCYALATSAPTERPVRHWDAVMREEVASGVDPQGKNWTLHIGGTFSDVPASTPFYRFVETLVHRGVTAGCTTATRVDSFCPTQAVTREQVAPFLILAREGPGYVPPPCFTPPYTDVPTQSPFCPWIQQLNWRWILLGCTPTAYCPLDPVQRGELARVMLVTLDRFSNPPPCSPPNLYPDVPETNEFCPSIEELARRGVVSDCGGGNFCPKASVTRETAAYFLTATFGLVLYGP